MMATNKPTIPEAPSEQDEARVIDRPDGFHWQTKEGARESGPFPTLLEAVQDLEIADEESPEPGETLQEAEAELGMADWIDPETGEPAEEQRPRIEEH
jgi:hypothetical protein